MGRPVRFKDAIYQAAAQLFGEHGLDGTSIRQISDLAGVSEAALYRHWNGKLDLAWEVFRSGLATLHETLQRSISDDMAAHQVITSVVECFYRLFDENSQLYGFVLLHQHDLWSKMTPDEPNPVRFWFDLVARVAGDVPQPERDQPDVVAAVTLGIVLRPAVATLYGGLTGPMSRKAKVVARAVCRVLYIDLPNE